MAAYTSTQAGNWSNAATWGGAGVPTIGDTASVGHVVTVDTNATVGTSPNDVTTYVVTVTTNGQLVIPNGVTLTVRGNFFCNPTAGSAAVSLQINGTGRLLFDGSPVSSTRSYNLRCVTRARVRLAGTDDANRAVIEAAAAGGFCQLQLDGNSPNLDNWNFARIIRAGDATNLATGNSVFVSYNWANAGQTISWTNVTFDNCGEIMLNAASSLASIVLNNVQHYSANKSSSTQGMQIRAQAGPGVAITITNCIFDTSVFFNGSQWMTCDNCYFGYSLRNSAGNTGFASSSNLFVVNRFVTSRTWYGTLRDVYWFHYTVDNLNFFINSFIPTSGADELSDMVLDFGNTSPQEPDGLAIANLPTATHYSVKNIFYLPDSAGVSSGAWFNVYPDPSNAGTCLFEHNTVVSALGSGGENCLKVGERIARAGMVTSFQSNLIWTPTGKVGGQRMNRHTLSSVQDIVSAANADYNWGWNLAAGNGYTVGSGPSFFSTGTPDVNGGTGDPQFVDPTRNLIRFDIDYLGNTPATAWADETAYAVGDVVSASDPDYFDGETINWRCVLAHTSAAANSTNGKPGDVSGFRTNWEPMSMFRLRENTARIALLQEWVKEGYAVQNASLNNAGHDGVTIGAGEYNGPIEQTPNAINLTTTVFAPVVTVTENVTATPNAALLTTSTLAPSVTATANEVATPTTAELSLSTFAPSVTVSDANTVTPQTATLTITTFSPTVTASASIVATPTTALLSLFEFAPTVTVASASVTVTPTTASLTLATFAPTLSGSAPTWTITFSGSEACRGDLTAIKTTGDLIVRQLTPV